MKYHIRKVKTGSDSIAVQVIKYENRKRVIVKHIGTAHNKDEAIILWDNAAKWIAEQTKQFFLFIPISSTKERGISKNRI